MSSQPEALSKAEKTRLAHALAKMPPARRQRLVELEAKLRRLMLP